MVKVIPLAATNVNWGSYLVTAKQALGRSVTQGLDNRGMKVNDLGSFLATLAEMKNPGTNPGAIPGSLLDHVHASFLVVAPEYFITKLIVESRLISTSVETTQKGFLMSVISGTVGQWQIAVANLSESDAVCRSFADQVISTFRQTGLGALFE